MTSKELTIEIIALTKLHRNRESDIKKMAILIASNPKKDISDKIAIMTNNSNLNSFQSGQAIDLYTAHQNRNAIDSLDGIKLKDKVRYIGKGYKALYDIELTVVEFQLPDGDYDPTQTVVICLRPSGSYAPLLTIDEIELINDQN